MNDSTGSKMNGQSVNGSSSAINNASSSSTNTTSSAHPSAHSNNLLVTTNESIKLIGESIGISNLSDEACREIASDLTFTIKSILLDSQKFARRSRRKNLIPSDIDYSLKVRSIEPIYGFDSFEQVPYKCTTSTGGTGSGRCLYYTEDQIVDLNELISANNQTVKLPNDFVINAHWLAIEGVQPSVPENPQLISRDAQKKEIIEGGMSKSKDKLLQHQQSQNIQQQRRNVGDNLVKLKSLIPHDLSMEQQIYFKEITEACVGSSEQKRTEALNSLSTDPGLHQLLPRFVLFISEGVRLNLLQYNMPILVHLMRMSKSLVENKAIYMEKYLHELLPSIISCQLNKQICAKPDSDNHYALREFCARLIAQIITIYSTTLTTLKPRVVKVYLNSLSDKTTFSTLFGAIVGLSELDNETCETFIFPMIKPLGERITQILDSVASNQEKQPADKVKQLLVDIVSTILKSKPIVSNDEFDYLTTEFGAYFGPLIHSDLMKFRSQKQTAAQAQLIAAVQANPQPKIVVSSNTSSNGNPQSNQRIVGTPVAFKIAQPSDKNRPPPATDSNLQSKPMAQDSCPLTLHISFLESAVTEETLRTIFEPFGIIEYILIAKDEFQRSKGYGQITFLNSEDGKRAMEQLNNYEIENRPIRISLTPVAETSSENISNFSNSEKKENNLISDNNLDLMDTIDTLNDGYNIDLAVESSANFAPYSNENNNSINSPLNVSPTECILLSNMFDLVEEKRKPNWAEEMREDILEECSKYGGIVHVNVDQNSPNGNVNIKYSNVTAAIEAMRSLNGRYFAGKLIQATYIPLANYHQIFPDSINSTEILKALY